MKKPRRRLKRESPEDLKDKTIESLTAEVQELRKAARRPISAPAPRDNHIRLRLKINSPLLSCTVDTSINDPKAKIRRYLVHALVAGVVAVIGPVVASLIRG